MELNLPKEPLQRVGSFSRSRERAGDEGVAHCADPLPQAGEGARPDPLVLYGETFASRLLLGTSRYPSPAVLHSAVQRAQPAMLTASLRREGAGSGEGNGGQSFWQLLQTLGVPVLPNTAGCHSADEVFTTAQMAREVFGTPWIKLELIGDDYSLQPDTLNLVEAARRLVRDGFKVLPYCTEDLVLCQRLVDAGCQAVMPWAAPIGTGKGPVNPYAMRLLRERLSVPLIVDAGLGLPSHACQVMEWGYDAVLLNTAVALAQDPVAMAGAFADAVRAGRSAFLAGAMREQHTAQPSTPVLGTPFWHET
ncbi:MAG: thiazole synthase [Methylibium sp.]|nr:thiazole synthase [Methylibium sp.]